MNGNAQVQWNREVVRTFLDWSRANWTLCCTEQHRHAKTFIETTVHEHLKLVYNLQENYQFADSALFAIPLNKQIMYSPIRNQDWIYLVLNSFETRQRQRRKHQSSIDNFVCVEYLNLATLLTNATVTTIKRTTFYSPTTTKELEKNNGIDRPSQTNNEDEVEHNESSYLVERESDIKRDVKNVIASARTTKRSKNSRKSRPG